MFGGLFKKKDNKMILGAPVKGKAVPLSESMIRLLQRRCLEKEWHVIPAEERFMLRQMARSVWYLIHSMQSVLYLKKEQRF